MACVFAGHRLPVVGLAEAPHLAPYRLAVQDRAGRADCPALEFPVEHVCEVVNGADQQAPDQTSKPPVDRLSGREVLGQHAPAVAGAGQVAGRVQDLAQVHVPLPAGLARRRQRSDPGPFLIGQVRRVALRLLFNLGHPSTVRSGPHPELGSRRLLRLNPFQTGSELKAPTSQAQLQSA